MPNIRWFNWLHCLLAAQRESPKVSSLSPNRGTHEGFSSLAKREGEWFFATHVLMMVMLIAYPRLTASESLSFSQSLDGFPSSSPVLIGAFVY